MLKIWKNDNCSQESLLTDRTVRDQIMLGGFFRHFHCADRGCVAHVIGHLVKSSVFATPFLKTSGKTFMPACIMLLSLAALINIFMTAKKEFKKVID